MEKMMTSKKGFGTAAVISFVVLVVVAVVGTLIVSNIRDAFNATGSSAQAAQNIADKGLSAFSNYAGLLPIVGIVLIATIVIGDRKSVV